MKRPSNKHTGKLKLAQNGADMSWVQIEFNSSLQRARQVECDILAACEKLQYGEADLFAIKLALEEALVNAVKHGNKLDPAKKVVVQYRASPQRVDVVVEDQGQGFNPASLPNPIDDCNLEASSGRGILLMRAYMSSVVYSPTGNKVTMTKFSETFQAERSAM